MQQIEVLYIYMYRLYESCHLMMINIHITVQ